MNEIHIKQPLSKANFEYILDGLTESPCKKCNKYNQNLPPDECIETFFDDCYIRKLNGIILIEDNEPNYYESHMIGVCKFEDCDKKCMPKSESCNDCSSRLSYRKNSMVPPSIIYKKILPDDWWKSMKPYLWSTAPNLSLKTFKKYQIAGHVLEQSWLSKKIKKNMKYK